LICGTNDQICANGDYTVLRDILQQNNSLKEFIEVEFGHLSIMNPNFEELKSEKKRERLSK